MSLKYEPSSEPLCLLLGMFQPLFHREYYYSGYTLFKAHRLVYHSTLGLRVIKKRRRSTP